MKLLLSILTVLVATSVVLGGSSHAGPDFDGPDIPQSMYCGGKDPTCSDDEVTPLQLCQERCNDHFDREALGCYMLPPFWEVTPRECVAKAREDWIGCYKGCRLWAQNF